MVPPSLVHHLFAGVEISPGWAFACPSPRPPYEGGHCYLLRTGALGGVAKVGPVHCLGDGEGGQRQISSPGLGSGFLQSGSHLGFVPAAHAFSGQGGDFGPPATSVWLWGRRLGAGASWSVDTQRSPDRKQRPGTGIISPSPSSKQLSGPTPAKPPAPANGFK